MEGVANRLDEPLKIDPRVLAMRMSKPGVAEDLTANGFALAEDFLATFIAADEKLALLSEMCRALRMIGRRLEIITGIRWVRSAWTN